MPSPVDHRVLGASAVTLAGIPVAVAAFLRLKYGPTVFADLAALRNTRANAAKFAKKNIKVVDFFEAHAKERPDKAFILYEDEVHTFGDLDKAANKLARVVQSSAGVACMDTVAIFMLNEPTFILSWLAFAKLGLRIAFLNYNLRGQALIHCIKVCNVKLIACGKDAGLVEALEGIMPELQALGITVWVLGSGLDQVSPNGMLHVDVGTLSEPADPIPRSVRNGQPHDDDALYIFTSGTTGLPKAARVPHRKQVRACFFLPPSLLTEDDVIHSSLPLYHSAAIFVGFFNGLRVGGTIALSTFSARRFWDEIRKYRVTIIQYIGEICRYLLAQTPRPDDGKYSHEVRFAIGLGLGPEIWEAFQKRFNIPRIVEYYGATDGTIALVNLDGKVGSVGRYHGIVRALRDGIAIVQCDHETAQPVRGPDGKCILTPSGDTGLLLIRLNDYVKFEGYSDKSANEARLLRNVKKYGDLFFNTGDLLVQDKDGYLYFKDRLGDTFRWKGENVSTTEVARVLNQYPGLREVNVYAVKVPGHDGKAGMAAIVFLEGRQLDPKSFYNHVVKELPLYACPKFLRIMAEMDITGTYKHRKINLAGEGFDPNVVSDPLFLMDLEKKTYTPLDKDTLRKVVVGLARL